MYFSSRKESIVFELNFHGQSNTTSHADLIEKATVKINQGPIDVSGRNVFMAIDKDSVTEALAAGM